MKIFLIEALMCSNMSYLVTPQKVYLLKSTICFCSQSSIYMYIIRESLHFKCFVYPEKNTYLLLTQANSEEPQLHLFIFGLVILTLIKF